jgi:hypothetical protein
MLFLLILLALFWEGKEKGTRAQELERMSLLDILGIH